MCFYFTTISLLCMENYHTFCAVEFTILNKWIKLWKKTEENWRRTALLAALNSTSHWWMMGLWVIMKFWSIVENDPTGLPGRLPKRIVSDRWGWGCPVVANPLDGHRALFLSAICSIPPKPNPTKQKNIGQFICFFLFFFSLFFFVQRRNDSASKLN